MRLRGIGPLLLWLCAGLSFSSNAQSDPDEGASLAQTQAPTPTPTPSPTPEQWPTIVAIEFTGNDVTQVQTLRRELHVRVGDPADPAALQASAQALVDLGLFKGASVSQQPVDGGVKVLFKVEERYYLFPTPRFDLKSDGQYAYGAQLAWDNLAGLNHSLRAYWVDYDRKRQDFGPERTFSLSYSAPFIFDSLYGLGLSANYTTRPVELEGSNPQETLRSAGIGLTRQFSTGAASQGWTLGGGLGWSHQSADDPSLVYGTALAPFASLRFRDFHYLLYSETGTRYGLTLNGSSTLWDADYNFTSLTANGSHYFHVGRIEHQTVHLIANLGMTVDGPERVRQFGLGGPGWLRGYETNFIEGNAYYRLAAEYARVLVPRWPWMRGVVILEGGNVFTTPADMNLDKVYTSLGLGLRLRLNNFVDLEVEAGWAVPLNGGAGRFFSSRV